MCTRENKCELQIPYLQLQTIFLPLQKTQILQLEKIYWVLFLILVINEHCLLTFWSALKSNSAKGAFSLSQVLTADAVRGQN